MIRNPLPLTPTPPPPVAPRERKQVKRERSGRPIGTEKELSRTNDELVAMRESGMTWRGIAAVLGGEITYGGVRYRIKRHQARLASTPRV